MKRRHMTIQPRGQGVRPRVGGRTRRTTGPERVDRLRERLVGKLSDTMDPDNAREMVDEFEREVRWEEQ